MLRYTYIALCLVAVNVIKNLLCVRFKTLFGVQGITTIFYMRSENVSAERNEMLKMVIVSETGTAGIQHVLKHLCPCLTLSKLASLG